MVVTRLVYHSPEARRAATRGRARVEHAWTTSRSGGRSGTATRSGSASFFLCTPPLHATPGGRASHHFYAQEVVYLCQREKAEESVGSNVRDQRTTVTQGKTTLECVTLPCTGSNQGLHENCRIQIADFRAQTDILASLGARSCIETSSCIERSPHRRVVQQEEYVMYTELQHGATAVHTREVGRHADVRPR